MFHFRSYLWQRGDRRAPGFVLSLFSFMGLHNLLNCAYTVISGVTFLIFQVLLWNQSVARFFGKCNNDIDTNILWRNGLSHSIYCLAPKIGIFFLKTQLLGGSVSIQFRKTSLQIIERPVTCPCKVVLPFAESVWNAMVLEYCHWSIIATQGLAASSWLVVAALVLAVTLTPGWRGLYACGGHRERPGWWESPSSSVPA